MNEKFAQISLAVGGSHYPSINPQLQQQFGETIVNRILEIIDAHSEIFQTDRDRAVIEHIKQSVKTDFGIKQ